MSKYRMKFNFAASDKPILVIIDMQPNHTSDLLLLNVIKHEITQAVANQLPVVLVQYLQCGEIYSELLDAAQLEPGSQLRFIIGKSNDNGAAEVLGSCRKNGLDLTHIKICGVNTNACVEETTLALAKQLPNSLIEVLGYACRNKNSTNDFKPFRQRNIVITERNTFAQDLAA
jgi:nicotinamidase-related amidase